MQKWQKCKKNHNLNKHTIVRQNADTKTTKNGTNKKNTKSKYTHSRCRKMPMQKGQKFQNLNNKHTIVRKNANAKIQDKSYT